MIPLMRPSLGDWEVSAVRAVIYSGQFRGGWYNSALESVVAGSLGMEAGTTAVTATAALWALLSSLGCGPEKEVVVSNVTCPSVAQAILLTGAKLVLVDNDPLSHQVDSAQVVSALSSATSAVVSTYAFAMPYDNSALRRQLANRGIAVIEDLAGLEGSTVFGRPVGHSAAYSIHSFGPTKMITGGTGGMVCGDAGTVASCREFLSGGYELRSKHSLPAGAPRSWLEVGETALDLELNEMNAAIVLTQLARIDELLAARRTHASRYIENLAGLEGASIFLPEPHCTPSWLYMPLMCQAPDWNAVRFIEYMTERGIQVRRYFRPLSSFRHFRKRARCTEAGLRHSEGSATDTVLLPIYPDLRSEEIDYICETIFRYANTRVGR